MALFKNISPQGGELEVRDLGIYVQHGETADIPDELAAGLSPVNWQPVEQSKSKKSTKPEDSTEGDNA